MSFDPRFRAVRAGALPVVTGVLIVKDAALHYPGAPVASGLAFTANFRPDTPFVPDLGQRRGGNRCPRASGVESRRPAADFAVRGNDLAAVASMLSPAGTQPAAARWWMKWPRSRAGPRHAGTGGHAHPERERRGSGLPKKVENVNGRIPARKRGRSPHAPAVVVSIDATVQRPLALMAAPGKVPPAEVEFAFRSTYLDLAELLPITPGAPFLPNATGGGRVAIDRLRQGKLDVTGVQAEVKLAPAVLESPHFTLQGYGGAVSGDARFDLRDTRQPAWAIHAAVDKVRADAILGAWTPVKDLLVGTLSSKLEFSGAGQTPDDLKHTLTLVGLAALTDGRLGPGPALEAVAQFVKVPKIGRSTFPASNCRCARARPPRDRPGDPERRERRTAPAGHRSTARSTMR
jgi:hypothetical protein